MDKKRKAMRKYKQMTFDTSVRNPERLLPILESISEFAGKKLTDDVLLEIVSTIYLKGFTSSPNVTITDNSTIDNIKFSVKQVNKSRKADGGFPKGYQSRFWTYMRTLSEFGLVYARYNEPFVISELALKYLNSNIDDQEVFACQSALYSRKSPYRRVLNEFNYFLFIYGVLTRMPELGRNYISHNEFIVSTFSKDGDIDDFLNLLKEKNFNSNESVYDYLNDLDSGILNSEYSKKRVMRDYPDTVLRMLRLIGLISLEYKGVLRISLNQDYLALFEELYNQSSTVKNGIFEDENKHYLYMNDNVNFLEIVLRHRHKSLESTETNSRLKSYIINSEISLDEVEKELMKIQNATDTSNVKFKYYPAPLRLEFLTSLLLVLVYDDELEVKPNYKMDNFGAPITTAPGRKGDIDVYTTNNDYWLVEVTTIKSRVQQINSETTNVIRHLLSDDFDYDNRYLTFVAPVIHQDTKKWFDYSIFAERNSAVGVYIEANEISEFIKITKNKANLQSMKTYSQQVISNI